MDQPGQKCFRGEVAWRETYHLQMPQAKSKYNLAHAFALEKVTQTCSLNESSNNKGRIGLVVPFAAQAASVLTTAAAKTFTSIICPTFGTTTSPSAVTLALITRALRRWSWRWRSWRWRSWRRSWAATGWRCAALNDGARDLDVLDTEPRAVEITTSLAIS